MGRLRGALAPLPIYPLSYQERGQGVRSKGEIKNIVIIYYKGEIKNIVIIYYNEIFIAYLAMLCYNQGAWS
jgi:hypothetical protein